MKRTRPMLRSKLCAALFAALPLMTMAASFEHHVLVKDLIVTGPTGNGTNLGTGGSSTGAEGTLSLSTASLNFGSWPVGTTSDALSVLLANLLTQSVGISSISAAGPFSATTSCDAGLAPASACPVVVRYSPTATGAQTGSLSIISSTGTQTISLTGAGDVLAAGAGSGTLSAANGFSGNFGVLLSGSSVSHDFVFQNTGAVALTDIFAYAPIWSHLTVSNNTCGTNSAKVTLAAGASCGYSLTYSPTTAESISANTTVFSSAGAVNFSISGSASSSLGALAPASGSSPDFGSVQVGGSATRNFVFSNTGVVSATGVYAQVSSGAGLSLANNSCGTSANPVTVAPGQSCQYSVVYSPTVSGSLSSPVSRYTQVYSSAPNSPSSVSLSGTGVPVFIEADGGVVSINGNKRVHTFTENGVFNVTAQPAGATISVVVVGGGGGGGFDGGGGGGGGVANYAATYSLPVGSYTVTIGKGGKGATDWGTQGGSGTASSFSALTAAGGGGGGSYRVNGSSASGGGGGAGQSNGGGSFSGGTGYPAGGSASNSSKGGGGGGGGGLGGFIGGAGSSTAGGIGSRGDAYAISGTYVLYGCGGGGGTYLAGSAPYNCSVAKGAFLTYTQAKNGATALNAALPGVPNTGQGGGGGGHVDNGTGAGADGADGVVIISYQYQ